MGKKEEEKRSAWAADQTFELEAIFPRGATDEQRRALTASVWLLGHLGGVGSRSRRGFGSLKLTEWSSDSDEWKTLLNEVKLADKVQQPMQWRSRVNAAREVFSSWFGEWPVENKRPTYYPHLGRTARLWLGVVEEFRCKNWQDGLNAAGRLLQDFRVRRPPDAGRFMAYVIDRKRIAWAPERSAFGLPLAFWDAKTRRGLTFVPAYGQDKCLTRWPSLMHIRLIKLGRFYHPMFVVLDGAVPGQPLDDVKVEPRVAVRNQARELLKPPAVNLLETFVEEKLKGAWSWMS